MALCLAFLFGGCESEQPSPTQSVPSTPESTGWAETAKLALGYDATASLHPINGDSQVNQDLTGLVYQGLYQLDNAFVPQPVLARSAQVSGDSLVWTIALKTGVVFSDGTPLTASHVAESLDMARNSSLYGSRLAAITSVSAGDGTVTIVLSAPNGNLPALLDVPVALDQGGIAPLGTGYYQYEDTQEGLTLRTNHHCPYASSLPYDVIPLVAVSSPDQRIAAFDTGAVTAVSTDFSGAYALGYSGSFETCDYPTTNMLYVGFRVTGGPCRSAAVRRAFSQSFDRETVTQSMLSGHAQTATLPISPVHSEYSAEASAQLDYDMASAAALLEEAGYVLNEEDGLRYQGRATLVLTLVVNSDSEVKQAIAQLLADSLASLGVTVEISTLAWEEYSAALETGQFDLYIGEVRLTGDFDATPLLTGALNYGGYTSGALSTMLAQWRGAQGEARISAASRLWQELAKDAPIAPLCFKNGSLLMRWGMATNLQPTRANPFWHMEEWEMITS